jgi:surface protein
MGTGMLGTLVAALGFQGAIAPVTAASSDVCSTPPSSIPAGAFVSCWDTGNVAAGLSGATQVRLPLVDPTATATAAAYNFTVNWGDGSSGLVTTWDDPDASHTYDDAGQYWVTITGTMQGFSFQGAANSGATADRLKLISVAQWGSLALGNSGGYFSGAANMNFTATDSPSLVGTTNLGQTFANATSFNSPVAHWDVSNVESMRDMFSGATSFNQPLAAWGTAKVRDFGNMFLTASSFNQPINSWVTTSVTDMGGMFGSATTFNQPLNLWNTSNVTTMAFMFTDAAAFDQDIGGWNTGNVRDFTWTFFRAAAFNNAGRPLDWDVRNVTSFSNMFEGTRAFNQDIGSWDMRRDPGVTINMHSMFHDADGFNQDLSAWDMSAVTDTSSMFRFTALFNNGGQPLAWGEKTGNITNMNGMFLGSEAFNQPINDWDTSKVTDMKEMFLSATVFQQDISDWQIGAVSTMEDMFTGITLPTLVYSAILTKWANQTTTTGVQAAVPFGAGNSGYLPSAAAARSVLTSAPYAWVITDGGLAPDTPTGFAATPGDGEITVSWDPVAGADSYEVTGTAAGGFGFSCQNVGAPPGTTCTWTGLANGLTYTLTLVAKNAAGAPSLPTAPLTTAARTTPAAPTITAITPGSRQFTVAFSAGDDGGSAITNYEYSTDGGATWTTRSPISFASPIIITGLTNGTAYNVRIRAVNAAGPGAESNQITATPRASAPPTPNPTPGPSPENPSTNPAADPSLAPTPPPASTDPTQQSADDIRALTPAQIRALTAQQLAALPPETFAVMTPKQIRALRPKQVRLLNASQIRAIQPDALRAMRPRTLKAFTLKQIRAVTDEQAARLRPKQINALGPKKKARIEQQR